MTEVALLLGPIAFRDFEVSRGVRFGGRQRLAVHQLNGGTRVIDVLGRDDAEIQVTGIFTGADATRRARQIDEFRSAGISLPLTWDVFFYTVFVKEFQADYRNGWWLPYSARFTVLRDEAAAVAEEIVSLTADISADASAALTLAAQAGLGLSLGSATVPSLQDLASAQLQISSTLTSVEAGWNSNGINNATSATEGILAIESTASASQDLAALSSATGYIGRAAANSSESAGLS